MKQSKPTDLLTPQRFRKTVGAQVRYAYKPIFNQLGKEARASANRKRSIGKMYRGLSRADRKMANASQRDYANQASAYRSFLSTVGAQDSADAQRIQSEQNKIATQYGGAPSTDASQRAAAASAQRGLSAANTGGYIQTLGANSRAYLRSQSTAAKHEGIGQKAIEAQRGRQISQDRRTALRERADFATKTAQEVRAAERDYLIQRGAFNLDKRSQAETARHNRAGERISAAEQARLAKQDRYDRNHPGAGSGSSGDRGGRTPTQIRDDKQNYRDALSWTTANIQVEPPRNSKQAAKQRAAAVNKFGHAGAVAYNKALRKWRKAHGAQNWSGLGGKGHG